MQSVSDLEEGNQQVGIMGGVYKFAKVVHIWLGEGSVGSELIFKYARRFISLFRISDILGGWYVVRCALSLHGEFLFSVSPQYALPNTI